MRWLFLGGISLFVLAVLYTFWPVFGHKPEIYTVGSFTLLCLDLEIYRRFG